MNSNQLLSSRVEREKVAHDERDVLGENRRLRSKFAHVDCYPSRVRLLAEIAKHVSNLKQKTVLDYGCGLGIDVVRYLNAGAAKVCGIDISEKYIEQAKAQCLVNGYCPDQYDLRVMDAHNLEYEANSFDYVIGRGILHHLDVKVALRSLHRVLKPGGRMLFAEPLADNPLLKLFRLLTPHARTEDERPFTRRQIADLVLPSLWESEISYCGIFEAPVSMATSILMPSKLDNWFLRAADKIEVSFNRLQILSSWNQVILFNLVKK
jgi:SAM-dependent methyltransferase